MITADERPPPPGGGSQEVIRCHTGLNPSGDVQDEMQAGGTEQAAGEACCTAVSLNAAHRVLAIKKALSQKQAVWPCPPRHPWHVAFFAKRVLSDFD